MKLKLNLTILLLALVFVTTNSAMAQEEQSNTPEVKPVMNRVEDRGNLGNKMKIENKIKPEDKIKINEKIELNKEMRKEVRDERKGEVRDLKASTSMMIKDKKAELKDNRMMLKNNASTSPLMKREIRASSTELFKKFKDEKREIKNTAKVNEFKIRKDALVKQLTITLDNLTNIKGRISERISTLEGEGKDMANAKSALAVAEEKLAKARTAVDALAKYVPVNSNGAAVESATADVELAKPRQIGDEAIKAVKEARDAFKEVVKYIAPEKKAEVTPSATETPESTN